MRAGDVVIFPQGDAHRMAWAEGEAVFPEPNPFAPDKYPHVRMIGNGRVQATLLCGFFGCDLRPFNPLIGVLPRMVLMPRVDEGWLAGFPALTLREWRAGRAGAETLITRMAELMFIEVLRRHVGEQDGATRGWLAGLADPVVGVALARLHERPAHRWTLVELAREVAASRSVLAERFTQVVGIPPMQYLAQWRLQLAAEQLATSSLKVSAIGQRVGYESEAAFSRAFKRATGVSPAQWRAGQRGPA
jgi:AraC-like DNA-binding protein